MSIGNRVSLIEARQIAWDFIDYIRNVCVFANEAGSIRRLAPTVSDIDIVCQPTSLAALWNRIERMEENGTIRPAIYPDGKKRWGDTMRGFRYMGMRIELHTCDANNRGYIYWLRTGGGEKNQFVMSQLIKHQSAVRFSEGYAWHVSYDPEHPRYNRGNYYAKLAKLNIPDEQSFYKLLGMPYIAPQNRSEITYRRYLARGVNCPPAEALMLHYADESERQGKLF